MVLTPTVANISWLFISVLPTLFAIGLLWTLWGLAPKCNSKARKIVDRMLIGVIICGGAAMAICAMRLAPAYYDPKTHATVRV